MDTRAPIPLSYPEETSMRDVPTAFKKLQIACGDGKPMILREFF